MRFSQELIPSGRPAGRHFSPLLPWPELAGHIWLGSLLLLRKIDEANRAWRENQQERANSLFSLTPTAANAQELRGGLRTPARAAADGLVATSLIIGQLRL